MTERAAPREPLGEGEENDAKVVISTNKESQKQNVVEVMRLWRFRHLAQVRFVVLLNQVF